ncbi:hypothetical protein VMCG_02078 [Cytospora schulzeri]|uniref:Peptidase S8/S53 domain-containing protein n=1 Tax=Cytospora schulzeri TaxID=448051 RepID=A0A423X2T3_9PEZI|nr:hypothetical protein VMCG_02078 [Valsa malicola]
MDDRKQKAKAMLKEQLATKASPITPEDALKKLFEQQGQSDSERQGWLSTLKNAALSRKEERDISQMHETLACKYQAKCKGIETEEDVLRDLLNVGNEKSPCDLKHLFAHGQDGLTILHIILDRSTYPDDTVFQFRHIRPLIRFLLRVNPELPAIGTPGSKETPLFMALKTQQKKVFEASEKEDIVRFLCEKNDHGLGSKAAIKSLAQMTYSSSSPLAACNAIHQAIESSDFRVSEDVLRELSQIKVPDRASNGAETPCLRMRDGQGRTCLHISLTAPFGTHRTWWAEKLTELLPELLQAVCTIKQNGKEEQLTPLQYFTDQKAKMKPESKTQPKMQPNTSRSVSRTAQAKGESKTDQDLEGKLQGLEEFLKRQCLMRFDSDTCKRIMYKKNNEREIFLTLEDDIVSWKFLESQRKHYKLDTSLKRLHICNSVSVCWDDASLETQGIAKQWGCAGNVDLFLVFRWLKTQNEVKKILEVKVDDGAGQGKTMYNLAAGERKPHSDQAIIECLRGLGVETLDWQRLDIPTEVIVEGAGLSVKSLSLYCSGLKAVLQSWADKQGLLEEVHVKLYQGLESFQWTKKAGEDFEENLRKSFKEKYPEKRLYIKCVPIKREPETGSAASKVKDKSEQGFEEQDWLKCMDEFAEIMQAVEEHIGLKSEMPARPIRVALIDDGVKTSYSELDNNIHAGKSGWHQPDPDAKYKKRMHGGTFRNYNSSHTGHGTVMAYYIKRVCPNVRLYVAKLEVVSPRTHVDGRGKRVTFSCDSAAEAIKWAVEEDVDIISMSWAIDNDTSTSASKPESPQMRLLEAINEAVAKNILLFCANPDKGKNYSVNDTLPRSLKADKIFCIGAATQDGVRWGQINSDDQSCDYFLPGVELGIQVESRSRDNTDEPPPEWLRSHNGMRKVFEQIQIEHTNSGWLPVRRFFDSVVKSEGDTEDKVKALEDDTRFDVVLLDYDLWHGSNEKTAELKSSFIIQGSNLGGEAEQGARVLDENLRNNGLTVQCDLAQITHGTVKEGGSPATLIVFQFIFLPRGKHRRFQNAEITIQFSAGDVQRITPDNKWTMSQSETQQELSHSVSPGLEAGFGASKATIGYTWELKESQTIEDHAAAWGFKQSLNQASSVRKRMNTVVWGFSENAKTKNGIPSFVQTAVLLARKKTEAEPWGQKFSADITIRGKVDSHEWVKDKYENVVKKMTGKSRKGDEVIFDPKKMRDVAGAKNLGEVNLDKYKQLVTIRPWVQGDDDDKPPEQNSAPEEKGPMCHLPPRVTTEPVAVPNTAVAAAASSPAEDPAKDPDKGAIRNPPASVPSGNTQRSQVETGAFTLQDAGLAGLISPDAAGEDWAIPLSDHEKGHSVEYLEEQLSLVRNETELVTQLVNLKRQERRLLQEIRKTRDQPAPELH